MLDPHTSLAIAQIVFYVPATPVAIYLLIRNGSKGAHMAWWPMIPLSLMRLAGGAVTIAYEKDRSSLGLIITAIVLLNVGAIPLIVATLGMIRIVFSDNFGHNPRAGQIARAIRLCFIPAIALLSAGGGVTATDPKLGRWLSLAGFILFAAILIVLIAMELYFWRERSILIPSSQKIIKGTLLAAPFIIVRNIYGILEVVFENNIHSVWSPVFGSVVAFALMALLTEYIAICIYFYVGYTIPPDRGVRDGPRDMEHDSGKL